MSQATAQFEHILIVDDDEDLAEMIRSFLVSNGFEVKVTGDGESGVRMIESEPPRLVVLDRHDFRRSCRVGVVCWFRGCGTALLRYLVGSASARRVVPLFRSAPADR